MHKDLLDYKLKIEQDMIDHDDAYLFAIHYIDPPHDDNEKEYMF